MISIKFMAIQLLFLLSLFASPAKAYPLYHLCGNSSDIFTSNSTYSSNLNLLLSTLYTNASAKGFATFTTGSAPNLIYGLTFCRGDIDIANCSSCISTAISDIEKLCPNNAKGAIWYDICQLYYSNNDILSDPDVNNSYRYILVNPNSVSANQLLRFEIQTIALMENVSDLVMSNKSRLFATGETALTAGNIIYGLMQCALDLSAGYCRSCLQLLVGSIELDDRKGRIGRLAMGLWCNMRYEFFKFYNGASMLQLSSDQPPSSPSTTNVSKPNDTDLAHGGTRKSQNDQTTIIQGMDLASKLKIRESNPELSLISFSSILDATCNFSAANKLGQGGFGSVYKGQLPLGEFIAIKRLDAFSGQGLEEFMNEVKLIAKLQHRNLVKLLGCCIEGEEKLLVYEYMPNNSLDYHLFDPIRKEQLDWSKRFAIIDGIAQGLLYLHKYSRVRIIHRDLKASNILLDPEMSPKISDFGMARIFDANTTQANTNRIVGTYGYMSPEYAMEGIFSIKSDVFSFGVLMLEIISGKRNTTFHKFGKALNLLAHAWELWKNGNLLDFVDPSLGDKIPKNEVSKCIIIALMCVQENAVDRPIMSEIITMLGSENIALHDLKKPAFFIIGNEGPSELSLNELATQNDITFTILDGRIT
ncbi:hypothetical protein IEQ34_021863 [Dendrobium chrysotoxum]|uniref:non-specific serine/threonine protein kinase n=1 Tax=Dendrobium chrysotoxum TaxID=161865 RepID=A0AAV7FX56_DENCH|nr:hypothetical protein IEQ34_021863 [Dendrobium chrysotoxum]